MKNAVVVIFSSVFMLASCQKGSFREDKVFAGGIHVKKETLNYGKRLYTEYCMACHGVGGDGRGVAAKGLLVPPRNFKTGVIKFGSVIAGDLAHDDTVMMSIRKGLPGSAMLPWDMSEKQLYAVVQYIKTFAPDIWEGANKELGEKIEVTRDPFGEAHKKTAVAMGKEVYHVVANCQSCHRAYVTKQELSDLNMKANGEPMSEDDFDEDMYKLKGQYLDHGDDVEVQVTPPDFTWHPLRSIWNVEDIYTRLVSGVGGGIMPSWKDTLTDQQIWAVAHYVQSLRDLRDDKEGRKTLMRKLKNQ